MEQLQNLIDTHNRIVFFGGAGVSCESGIPDYRSRDGIYNRGYTLPPETLLSHTYFMRHTEGFYRFYRDVMLHPEAKPNAAHLKLAQLEKAGKLVSVVTQNIDGLHQKAGSRRVHELHGSVHRNACMSCGNFFDLDFILQGEGIPKCTCGGMVKPDVVLYEESLDGYTLEKAVEALQSADLLLIGGTSLAVYPAAGLIQYFGGKRIVLLNRDVTPYDGRATLCIREPIGQVLEQIEVR